MIRVPKGVDKAGFARDLRTAIARVPVVVAVELLSVGAAHDGDLSESDDETCWRDFREDSAGIVPGR